MGGGGRWHVRVGAHADGVRDAPLHPLVRALGAILHKTTAWIAQGPGGAELLWLMCTVLYVEAHGERGWREDRPARYQVEGVP